MNLSVSCNYLGGNIKVIYNKPGYLKVEQELRDTKEWWFYWNFSASSSEPGEMIVEFRNGEVLGPWGPAYSINGIDWDWLGAESKLDSTRFRYQFTKENEPVYFAFSLPYQVHHFERFYAGIHKDARVHRDILTLSEQLRAVPILLIGNPEADKHIVFTCRHHACESTPSYMLEGLIEHMLLFEPAFLKQHRIHYVPFVDIDGVENGDQGKARAPRDHNRDYDEEPLYQSTRALMNYVRSLDSLYVGFDFHGPWKWGGRNDVPFFAKHVSPIKEESEKLGRMLQAITADSAKVNTASKSIQYDPIHDLEMGQEWLQLAATCSHFFEKQKATLCSTFEFPYFGSGDLVYTTDACRRFGADFAKALADYATGSL